MDAWKHVASDEHILDGFRQCGYFDFDGTMKSSTQNCVTPKTMTQQRRERCNITQSKK